MSDNAYMKFFNDDDEVEIEEKGTDEVEPIKGGGIEEQVNDEQEKLKTAKMLEALAQGIGFDKDGKPVFAGKRITTTAQILPADIQIDEIYVQNRQGTQPAVKPVYDKAIDTAVQEAVSDFDKKHLNINLLESYLDQRKEVVEKFAEFHEKQKQVMQVFDEKKQIAQDLGFKYVFGKQHGDLLSEDFLSCLYDSESYQSEKLESKICDDSNLSFEYQLDEIAKTIQYKIGYYELVQEQLEKLHTIEAIKLFHGTPDTKLFGKHADAVTKQIRELDQQKKTYDRLQVFKQYCDQHNVPLDNLGNLMTAAYNMQYNYSNPDDRDIKIDSEDDLKKIERKLAEKSAANAQAAKSMVDTEKNRLSSLESDISNKIHYVLQYQLEQNHFQKSLELNGININNVTKKVTQIEENKNDIDKLQTELAVLAAKYIEHNPDISIIGNGYRGERLKLDFGFEAEIMRLKNEINRLEAQKNEASVELSEKKLVLKVPVGFFEKAQKLRQGDIFVSPTTQVLVDNLSSLVRGSAESVAELQKSLDELPMNNVVDFKIPNVIFCEFTKTDGFNLNQFTEFINRKIDDKRNVNELTQIETGLLNEYKKLQDNKSQIDAIQ